MVIQVTSLTLHPEASILDDPNVKQVFVAYKFLDYEPADLETPISLPKPAPHRPISFNFKKGKVTLQNIFPCAFVATRKQCALPVGSNNLQDCLTEGGLQQLVCHSNFLPFLSVFHVDAENNQVKRNYLIYMLSNDPK